MEYDVRGGRRRPACGAQILINRVGLPERCHPRPRCRTFGQRGVPSPLQIQGKDRAQVAEAGTKLDLDGTYIARSYIEQVGTAG